MSDHVVEVQVAGKVLGGWIGYEISSSMTEPADSFSMSRPFDLESYRLCRPDAEVSVTIDGVSVLRGFIDDRRKSAAEGIIEIGGRDRAGRLVQESAPQVEFNGLPLTRVIEKLASPWFSKVTTSNARNRRVQRGMGKKARSATEPVFLDSVSSRRIDPGQMRWAVIEDLASQAGYLVWSSADGLELVVGSPNYQQEPNWFFVHAAPGSALESTVEDLEIVDSVGDRYSRIIALGAGAGTDASYGPTTTSRTGEARDNPATVDGTGLDFAHPKTLVLVDDAVRSAKHARELADREMARRNASAQIVSVVAPGHGQLVGGVFPTLFAPDTIAHVVDEEADLHGRYLVVSCQYTSRRGEGEATRIEMVPVGTELAP